jgi:hypothetical protein
MIFSIARKKNGQNYIYRDYLIDAAMKHLMMLLGLLLCSVYCNAQLTLSGELRPRYEYRNGYKKMPEHGTVAANVISQRTRLGIGWMSKRLGAKVAIQDVRIWGDEAAKKDVAGMGLYEGWLGIYLADSIAFRIGRQELLYDNQRLIDNGNWGQKGVTHDALLFALKKSGWALDIAAAFNQSRDTLFSTDYNTGLGNYKALGLAILSKRFGNLKVSGWSVVDAYQKKNTTNTLYLRATQGLTGVFYSKPVSAGLRGFYQSGQCEAGNFIRAFYGSADVTGRIGKNLRLGGGFELQTGQDSTEKNEGQVHYFTTLYGSSHSFNGYMDYFTKPADTRNTGLWDAFLKLGYKVGERLNLAGDLHYFAISGKFPDKVNGGSLDPFLAWEADLTVRWAFYKDIELQAGYSALFGSQTLRTIAGGDPAHYAHWAYLMLTYKPVFLRWDPDKN